MPKRCPALLRAAHGGVGEAGAGGLLQLGLGGRLWVSKETERAVLSGGLV